jgi:glucose-6-phosphate 1-dehydrogenase
VVVGASGDLAKKKTYPSLLHLFFEQLLPPHTVIWGYARSRKTHDELRIHLKPHLMKTNIDESIIDDFLNMCYYHSGTSYGDEGAYKSMIRHIETFETTASSSNNPASSSGTNRLFYLAVPPNVFGECGVAIRRVGMTPTLDGNGSNDSVVGKGWTRIVIEKPFGHDLDSCNDLLGQLASQFDERHLYRIDHYLGKEVVQNLMIFRFGNSFWEQIWNSRTIESVTFSFKEVRFNC